MKRVEDGRLGWRMMIKPMQNAMLLTADDAFSRTSPFSSPLTKMEEILLDGFTVFTKNSSIFTGQFSEAAYP